MNFVEEVKTYILKIKLGGLQFIESIQVEKNSKMAAAILPFFGNGDQFQCEKSVD